MARSAVGVAAMALSLLAVLSTACGSAPSGVAGSPGTSSSGVRTATPKVPDGRRVPASSPPSGEGPRGLAAAEAAQLVRLVRLPAGARELDKPPLAALAKAPIGRLSEDFIDQVRWWTVPAPAAVTLAYLGTHQPRGLSRSGSGIARWPGSLLSIRTYADRPAPAYRFPVLQITVTDDGPGGSAVRADGQVSWIPGRTAAEHIPLGVTDVHLLASRWTTGQVIARGYAGRATAARLARIIDGLQRANDGPGSCAASDFQMQASFAAGGHTWVVTDVPACGAVLITTDGRVQPGLEETPGSTMPSEHCST
jgi:hypothetical protein